MKMKSLKKSIIAVTFMMAGLLTSNCSKILDKNNLSAIQADDVWNNLELAKGYINGIYAALMPGMPIQAGSFSDEAGGINYLGSFDNPYGYGTATINTTNIWNYDIIRNINFMLEKIDAGTIAPDEKDKLKGQAYFWRAWAYWRMVESYGGVPLVLEVQQMDDLEKLNVKRNKTSECISQIIKDLDLAMDLLPDTWDGSNVGRIDRCATLAFKARILLFYASPQFNPTNLKSRWQDAYNASKEAIEFCEKNGKGLYESFSGIWTDELNKEVIMVKQYSDPGSTYSVGCARPILWSANCTGWDQPSL